MSARQWPQLLADAAHAARLSLHEDDPAQRWELRAEAEWLLGEATKARRQQSTELSTGKVGAS